MYLHIHMIGGMYFIYQYPWPVTRKMFPFGDFIMVCNQVDTASPLNNGSTYIYTNVFTDNHSISLFRQEYCSLSVEHIKL